MREAAGLRRPELRPLTSCVAESGGSEMSAGSGSGAGAPLDARRPSTCRVELGALLAPEPRPLDNKVKVSFRILLRLPGEPIRKCSVEHFIFNFRPIFRNSFILIKTIA